VPVVFTNKENDLAATAAQVRGTAQQCPCRDPTPALRRVLFGHNYLLFPPGKFRCYFEKFHCSEKRRFGCKPLKLLTQRRVIGPGFSKIRC
jgi:hypothetical protein